MNSLENIVRLEAVGKNREALDALRRFRSLPETSLAEIHATAHYEAALSAKCPVSFLESLGLGKKKPTQEEEVR